MGTAPQEAGGGDKGGAPGGGGGEAGGAASGGREGGGGAAGVAGDEAGSSAVGMHILADVGLQQKSAGSGARSHGANEVLAQRTRVSAGTVPFHAAGSGAQSWSCSHAAETASCPTLSGSMGTHALASAGQPVALTRLVACSSAWEAAYRRSEGVAVRHAAAPPPDIAAQSQP